MGAALLWTFIVLVGAITVSVNWMVIYLIRLFWGDNFRVAIIPLVLALLGADLGFFAAVGQLIVVGLER